MSLSFKQTKNQKERKTYNFNTYKIHKKNIIFLNSKNKNKKSEMKNNHTNESKYIKSYNDKNMKNIKKIKIKKIDIIDKSNISNNENIFFNLNNYLERLIKENNLIKEKTNKKFRFCKSTK